MSRPLLPLLPFVLLGLASVAPAQPPPAGGGKAPGAPAAPPPLLAEGVVVKAGSLQETVPTVGTLQASESVIMVSELSRRLVKVLVQEGADVQAGEILFKLDDTDLRAEITQIEARRRLAADNETRARDLLASKAISQQGYDEAKSALDALDAEKSVKQAELDKTEIRAPFAGRTGLRLVSEGAWVTPTTKLISLQDLSKIKVDFPLPERYADDVRPGLQFTFTVAGNVTQNQGVVTVVEPQIDPATRSLLLRGVADNPGARLLPGGFAEVSLALENQRAGFAIPTQAVIPSVRGQSVYVLRDGKAALQDIKIGLRTADQVQVTDGLKEGDTVLTTGLLRLRPGSDVKLVAPKAQP